MQQEDQNSLRIARNPNPQTQYQNQNSHTKNKSKNIIETNNLLSEGFNYIIPYFWYQELLDLNQNVSSFQTIKIPSLSTYEAVLKLCGLTNPSLSIFKNKNLLTNPSQILQSDILQESNFIGSRSLKFSKNSTFVNQNQFQWRVVSPLIWRLIERISNLQQTSLHQKRGKALKKVWDQKDQNQDDQTQNIPKIVVFLQKQFIVQKGKSKNKQSADKLAEECTQVVYKNRMYKIPNSDLNTQISNQLKKMGEKQLHLILLIDKTFKNGHFFEKYYVSGFFYKELPFKDLVRSLITTLSLESCTNAQKFYLHDKCGQRIIKKISRVNQLQYLDLNDFILVSTVELSDIQDSQTNVKRQFETLVQRQFNFPTQSPYNNLNQTGQDDKQNSKQANQFNQQNQFIGDIRRSIQEFAYQRQVKSLNTLIQNQKKHLKNNVPIGDYTKEQSKIQNGTFFRTTQHKKNHKTQHQKGLNLSESTERRNSANQIQSQNQALRNLDSATTNFDTLNLQYENNSEHTHSRSPYRNIRLHRHSSMSRRVQMAGRVQRKKKSQNFILKKQNKIITAANHSSSPNLKENIPKTLKKRIDKPLFLSLFHLQKDGQTRQFLLNNMRKVARESIFSSQTQMIMHPYSKGQQIEAKQRQKHISNESWFKSKTNQPQQNSIRHSTMQQSLDKIARQIQKKYEPEIEEEKYEREEKNYEKQFLEKIQFQEDYQQYFLSKKDEQIKTIVDNSEGLQMEKPLYTQIEKPLYSQMEKQNLRFQFSNLNARQRVLIQKSNFDDENPFMSDPNNQYEENDETI